MEKNINMELVNDVMIDLEKKLEMIDCKFSASADTEKRMKDILNKFAQKWGYLAEADEAQLRMTPLVLANESATLTRDICNVLGLNWYRKPVMELSNFIHDVVAEGILCLHIGDEDRLLELALRVGNQLPVYIQVVVDELNKL